MARFQLDPQATVPFPSFLNLDRPRPQPHRLEQRGGPEIEGLEIEVWHFTHWLD